MFNKRWFFWSETSKTRTQMSRFSVQGFSYAPFPFTNPEIITMISRITPGM